MPADFFTKPLQGSLFRRLKAVLFGHAHISTLKQSPPVTGQERVERNVLWQIAKGPKTLAKGPASRR